MNYLVPVGNISRRLLLDLRSSLSARFETAAGITRAMTILPDTCAVSGRYNSSCILEQLRGFALTELFAGTEDRARSGKVLGVIDADLYAPGMTFVFGEAERPGIYALISLARLKTGFYGRPPDDALLFERTLTEATHELGHTYGLRHCADPGCVMYFSSTIADTDRKGMSFCPECRENLVPMVRR